MRVMSKKVLFDASALLMLIQQENSDNILEEVVSKAVISSVNLSEVMSVLIRSGMPKEIANEIIKSSITDTIPFSRTEAELAGELISHTKSLGLSLGDRACIATSIIHNLELYSADQAWQKLNIKNLQLKLVRNKK